MIATKSFRWYWLWGGTGCLLAGYFAINGLLPLNAGQLKNETSPKAQQSAKPAKHEVDEQESQLSQRELETATLGAGCFWCSEAVFAQLEGVQSVKSGYMGGRIANPTYNQVLTGLTGHAEVAQIQFDASQISFAELLEVFWKTHDPTTLNRQGNDTGTQYRSVVFYHSQEQKHEAERYKEKLTKDKVFRRRIVTQIAPAAEFYLAENYHQDFYELNPRNRYCRAVVQPKLKKLKAVFGDKLKDDPKKAKKSSVKSEKSSREKTTAEKSTHKKSTAEKSTAEKSTAEKSTAEKSTDRKSPDKKSPDKKSPDKKSPDKKSPDKKSTDEKSANKKSTDEKSTAEKSTDEKSTDEKSTDEKSVADKPR